MTISKIGDALSIINDNLALVLALLTTIGGIIEFNKKIPFRPFSAIFRYVGKMANKELSDKVDNIDKQVKDININVTNLKCEVNENKKKELKVLISDFASDLRAGIPKSETQFIAINELAREYLDNGWNSKIQHDAEYIECEYKKRYYN